MNTNAVHAYRKAWKALNTMLEEGRSYSGFERNCAFLNLGGESPRFADISGACGLDLMDDGRAIAVVDWDFDGKLDFWISNRTAPRLRLQHNRSQTGNGFVALKLIGKTCNRDAVGARVELVLKDASTRMVRTLRAGEGFLAQSSMWMHFGLAEGAEIAGLKVSWPGGDSEDVAGIAKGRFFIVEQGSGNALPWDSPTIGKPLAERPLPAELAPPSAAARIVMASRLPFPQATFLNLAGERAAINGQGQPLLINLWATWCAPCVAEMDGWTREQAALRELGIGILALSVDNPDDPVAERAAVVKPFLKKSQFPFDVGLADAGFLEVLEVAGRAQIDKYETLPVPSSILLDANGRIAVIYKGPVEAQQLAADVELLDAPAEVLNAEAAHFPGRWIESPWPAAPTGMIDKFLSFGQPEAAKRYLDQFTITGDARANAGLAESYYLVGSELGRQKNLPEALKAFTYAITLNPENSRIRLELATLLFRMQNYPEAIPHLRLLVEEQPSVNNTRKMLSLALIQTRNHAEAVDHLRHLVGANGTDPIARLWLGHALIRVRKAAEAAHEFRESLKLQPDSFVVANELAWLLATHSNGEIRNPEEALKLATAAAQATKYRQADVLDTLAAAQAANGDFTTALETVNEAVKLAQAAKDERRLQDLQRRRKIYEQGRPYREIAPAEG